MKKRLTILALISGLLILFTIACIKWPDKAKPLGDEYTCHIYSQDSFFQFYPRLEEDGYILKRGHDDVYECQWTFVYNEDAHAYEIYTDLTNNDRVYLSLGDDNELVLACCIEDNSDRWNLTKIGNTMFYAIVNVSSDYALTFDEGNSEDVGSSALFDEDNFEFWMRLQ